MDPKLLYHFTSLETFIKIWSSRYFKFAQTSGLNDINEVTRIYFNDDKNSILQKEIEKYKQISLCFDYDNPYQPCMSPLMWGHYGCKGQGVCIELDFSKLNFAHSMFHNRITYVDNIEPIIYDGSDIKSFIVTYQDKLFFTKTIDWHNEQEFRIVSNEDNFLPIYESCSAIIITSIFGADKDNLDGGGLLSPLYKTLKSLLEDKIEIWEYNSSSLGGTQYPILRNERGESRIKDEFIIDDGAL